MVQALLAGPKTPTEIAHQTGLQRSNVSRTLGELSTADIVYCQTPHLRKGRLYGVTPESTVWLKMPVPPENLPRHRPQPTLKLTFRPRVRGEAMTAGVAAASELLDETEMVELTQACGINLLKFERDAWYSMEIHHDFLRQLAALFDGASLELCHQVGRRSIAYLPFLLRFLADRNVNLHALAERAPLVHDYYFNFGRYEVATSQDGLEFRQFDMLPIPEFCSARGGNYRGVMEAKGYPNEIRERVCALDGAPFCAFPVRVEGRAEAR